MVVAEKVLPQVLGEPDRAPLAQKDGTGVIAEEPIPFRARDRAPQLPAPRIQSMWEDICNRRGRESEWPAKASVCRAREWPAEIASWRRGFLRQACCIKLSLMQDTHNFRFEFREFDRQDGSARMQNQVAPLRKQLNMAPQGFAHTSLDSIALVRLADNLPDSEPYARPGDLP